MDGFASLSLIFSLLFMLSPLMLSDFFSWHNIHFDFVSDSIIILSNSVINCYSYPA